MEETLTHCPNCEYPLEEEEGLAVCYHCGWFEGCDEEEEDV